MQKLAKKAEQIVSGASVTNGYLDRVQNRDDLGGQVVK
jgi:hypothetical protein